MGRPWTPSKCTLSRSLRELFLIIVLVAGVSVVVTYQVSKYVLARQHAQLQIHVNGRVDIYRNFPLRGRDLRRSLEGVDVDRKLRFHRYRDPNKPPSALEKRLVQLEDSLDGHPEEGSKEAVVCGDADFLDANAAVYAHSLRNAGFTVHIVNLTEKSNCANEARLIKWNFLFCLVDHMTTEIDQSGANRCISAVQLQDLLPYQKVGFFGPAYDHLWQKDDLCRLFTNYQYIPSIKHSQLSPPCFSLPDQLEEFLDLADAKGADARWVFKDPSPGFSRMHILQPTNPRDFNKLKELGQNDLTVQQYQEDPLLLFGMPFTVTAYVLVTSLSPLRAYLHSDGVIQFRHDYQRSFQKVEGRTWTLEHYKQHLTQSRGKEVAQVTFSNMEAAITETLLLLETESERGDQDQGSNRFMSCKQCFQLLGFDIIFNSSFHPIVTEVSLHPSMHEISHQGDWATEDDSVESTNLLDDLLLLLSGGWGESKLGVASEVGHALQELGHHVGALGVDCQPFHKICLTDEDLSYLVAARREAMYRGGFSQLYPSYDAERYSGLMEDLQRFAPTTPRPGYIHHGTANLHPILVSLERYYHSLDAVDDSYDDLNLPQGERGQTSKNSNSYHLIENIFHNSSNKDKKYVRQKCSEEKEIKPHITGIYAEPQVNITPPFQPHVTDYYVTVPYDLFLIKVWSFASSCSCEARLDGKYGLSRPSNYTLGLGSNRVTIVVVDVTHTEPWILNTYSLHIYREGLGERKVDFKTNRNVVCQLQQDCDLPLMTMEPCGLQPTHFKSWMDYKHESKLLPNCSHGNEEGRWMVACSNCSHGDTCAWNEAKWQPYSCSHPVMARDRLKKCLVRKQIMFIGDSTNRGMMHYLMEQVNDTLTEWDKTHNIKVYNNINHDQTSVSFAYYPQFWLPANQRPVFDKALYQLIKRSQPLENNHNTVLVVGGVHWLASHHLSVVFKALNREGLENILVVVKGLGAGFHQPVDGLHCLTQREHRKLLIHNSGIMEFARRQGYALVDTFNMTMSRYKDFLQGKCACHFHRVKETLPSFSQFLQSTGSSKGKLVDMPIMYHVEGPVNAEYSEMLLNRICDYR